MQTNKQVSKVSIIIISARALSQNNFLFLIPENANAIPAARKSALTFTLCILTSHNEKLIN
jgi:hypothetical protein